MEFYEDVFSDECSWEGGAEGRHCPSSSAISFPATLRTNESRPEKTTTVIISKANMDVDTAATDAASDPAPKHRSHALARVGPMAQNASAAIPDSNLIRFIMSHFFVSRINSRWS